MIVIKSQDSTFVKLKAGEDIFTVLRDPKGQLKEYQNSIAALQEENQELMDNRKLPWWIIPGDEFRLPKKMEKKEPRGEAAVDYCHHFKMRRFPQVVDVYMGFMDEEVNARLAHLVKSEAEKEPRLQRPVVLIERGRVEPGEPILEWRMGNYPINGKDSPVKRIVQTSPNGQSVAWEGGKRHAEYMDMQKSIHWRFWEDRKVWLEKRAEEASKKEQSFAPEDIIARAMAVYMQSDIASDLDWLARGLKLKKYFDVVKLLQHRGRPDTKSNVPEDVTGQGPYLSVVRFDVGNEYRAPIVVIRSPEMGLQPSLMCPYLAFLFKALSAAASEMAAVEAKRYEQVVVAKGEWSRDEYKDELWEEGDPEIYKEDGKKLKKWDLWEWPLRVSQFGVQGSTSELAHYRPGSIVTVVGSLFVGVEIASHVAVAANKGGSMGGAVFKHGNGNYEESAGGSIEKSPHWVDPNRKVPPDGHVSHDYEPYSNVIGSATTVKAYAVISLCTPAGVYDFLREEIKDESDRKRILGEYELEKPQDEQEDKAEKKPAIDIANELAAEIFQSQVWENFREKLHLKSKEIDPDSPFKHFEEDIGDDETLESVIDKIRVAYKKNYFQREGTRDGVITLTVAYFGGDADKAASDALGMMGVNMEDYHILRVLRSALAKGVLESSAYPIILGWRIDRINADPKELPKGIEENFNSYARSPEALMTVDDYVRVAIWGLRGVLKSDIEARSKASQDLRAAVDWRFLKNRELFPNIEELKKYFWSFVDAKTADEFWVPDPFCIEMASDFLTSLHKWKEKKPGFAQFNDRAKVKKIKEKAAAALKAWETRDCKKDSFAEVYDDRSAEGTKARLLDLMIYLCKECGFAANEVKVGRVDGKTPMKTWLRPTKWDRKNILEPTLQDAAATNKFKAAAIDRAFYKSSNMMALQTMADHGLW